MSNLCGCFKMDTVNILLLLFKASDGFICPPSKREQGITYVLPLLRSPCPWPFQDHLVLPPSEGQKVSVLLSRPTAGGCNRQSKCKPLLQSSPHTFQAVSCILLLEPCLMLVEQHQPFSDQLQCFKTQMFTPDLFFLFVSMWKASKF